MSSERKRIWPQFYASFSISLGGMSTGIFLAYSSVAIPLLSQPPEDGGWGLTTNQGSWIASLFFLGTIFGTASSGLTLRYFGAKRVCLAAAPLTVLAWTIFYFATGIEMAFVARILSGLCYGNVLSSVKVYSPEVSHKDWRGATSSIYPVLLSFGILCTFATAYFIRDWRTLAAVATIPPILNFVMILFVPDSPYWLVENGEVEKGKEALIWLRGPGSECDREFEDIVQKMIAKSKEKNKSVFEIALSSTLLRPLMKVGPLVTLVEFGGMNMLTQYLTTIFQKSGSSIDSSIAPIAVAGTRMAVGCLAAVILRYTPRKPLFVACSLGAIVSYSCLGIFSRHVATQRLDIEEAQSDLARHSAVQSLEKTISSYGWVPLVALMSIQVCDSVGFLTIINFNLQAESFPTEVRAFGCALCGVFAALARLAVTKTYPDLIDLLQFHAVFWFFAFMLAIVMVYGIIIMPENKGQSLTTTEDAFTKK